MHSFGRRTSRPVCSDHRTARAEKSSPYRPASAAITRRRVPSADHAIASAEPVSSAASTGLPSRVVVYGS